MLSVTFGSSNYKVFIAVAGISTATAYYLLAPASLLSKFATFSASTIGAWGITEGSCFVFRKSKSAIISFLFNQSFKRDSIPSLSEKEKNDISNLLDNLLKEEPK